MKTTLDKGSFIQAFKNSSRADQFSREALGLIWDHMEEMGTEDVELDVIAVCCDWSEYDSLAEMLEENAAEDLQEMERKTTVLYNDEDDGPFVVLAY
jgi:stress response protein SCP2